MNFTRSAFARRAAIAILAAIGAALPQLASAQTNPLAGTWKFVPDKSTFTPGPAPYKELTLKSPDGTVMNLEGVDAKGNPVNGNFTAVIDGKPHPITGMARYDAGMWTRNSDTNTSYRYTKGKGIAALGTRVLSPDGSTLTFREQLYDDKGKQISTAVMTFVNPDVKVASVTPNAGAAATPAPPPPVLTPEETAAVDVLSKGNDDEAIRLFTAVIQGKPTPMLYYDHISRGIAYARKGQTDMAMADFDAAIKLKPDNADAHFRRGGMLVQMMKYNDAIQDLTATLQVDPMNAVAYSLRSFSYFKLERNADGQADTDKACALDKQFCTN